MCSGAGTGAETSTGTGIDAGTQVSAGAETSTEAGSGARSGPTAGPEVGTGPGAGTGIGPGPGGATGAGTALPTGSATARATQAAGPPPPGHWPRECPQCDAPVHGHAPQPLADAFAARWHPGGGG